MVTSISTQLFRLNVRSLRLATVLAAISAIVVLGACSVGAEKAGPATREAVPVVVATVQQRDVPVQVRAIGNVEPYSTVQVKSQVTGELVNVHFTQGQDVRKGALLFTIDGRPFEAEVSRQEGNLARDLAQAQNERARARRYEQLFKEGVISKEQFDQVRTNADALDASVRADRAALEAARLNLHYCQLYAPIDGRTGDLMVHQGNMVKANDVPLVTINQVQPIYVSFSVPEQHLADIKRFMARGKLKVTAKVPGARAPAEGTVTFVDNTVDPATGTIKLKATFANAERRLWPGQFADVMLTLTTQAGAIVVPAQAVQTGQQGDYVFVVKNDQTAEQRSVRVERTMNGQAVIAEGLKPGEQVVTDGQVRLAPSGTKVEVKTAMTGGSSRHEVSGS